MALDPQWSEQLTSSGGPGQPLHATSVRNGLLGTITRAITTDVTLRGRYTSVFTWGQHLVETHPAFSEASTADKKQAIYTLEKILALGTLRYQETHDVEAGTSGLVGKNRLRASNIFDSDPIDLSAFSLRDGTTAVRLTNTNRYYLFLRERDTELGLTGVGKELAEAVDRHVSAYRDDLVNSLITESVSLSQLDTYADTISFQTLYEDSDTHSDEQDVLIRVYLGLISWDMKAGTATLDPLPESLDLRVLPYLQYETSDRRFENELRDDVASEILRLQRAWTLFMLQVIDEYSTSSETAEYSLDTTAQWMFAKFRQFARVYWLQEFTAVMLRLHLWLFCELLQRELPRSAPRGQVFSDLLTDRITAGAKGAFELSLEPGTDSTTQTRAARELALYGSTPQTVPTVRVPELSSTSISTLGDLRGRVRSHLPQEWSDTNPSVCTSTLTRGLRSIIASLDEVSPKADVIETWQHTLGHSLTLLVMICERYRRIAEETPVIDTYVRSETGGDQASVASLEHRLASYTDEMPLSVLGQKIIEQVVIGEHERVVRQRLRNNNPIRLSFSYDAAADAFRYEGGASPISREYLRFHLMQQMLLDIGLVTTVDDDARLTRRGEDLLARGRCGDDSS